MPGLRVEFSRKTLFESGTLQISLFEARPRPDALTAPLLKFWDESSKT